MVVVLMFALVSAVFPALARAQLYTESSVLHGDPGTGEYFGYFVAASGDTLAVSCGSSKQVYVYVRSGSGWTLQQKFAVNIPGSSNGYLAIDGDTLVVAGEIWTRSGGVWSLQQSLGFSDPYPALQGDTLAISDPWFPENSSQGADGAVYVYTRSGTTWTRQATLSPSVSGLNEHMGTRLALDGDTIIAGTYNGDNNTNHGGAYVFVRNGATWTQQARLPAPSGHDWIRVALEGNTAAIADPLSSLIHVFTRSGSTWTQTDTIPLPTQGGSYLGDRIVLNGGYIAAWAGNMYYVFSRTPIGWTVAQSYERGSYFFGSLALANQGKLLAIGNPFGNPGVVETFSTPPPPPPGSGWRDADIGAVGLPGSSTVNGATVAVSGSGADIWDRSDQFHFRSETLTGDGAIIAHVDSAGSGHAWSKVGLMFREDVAPSARTVMALVTPGSHLGQQTRVAAADITNFQDAGWAGAPIWLMLARSGDLFASYRSDDGSNWTPIGSATVTMPATIHVGLAVSSHDNAALNTGTFSGVELVGGGGPPPGPVAAPSNLTGSLVNGTYVHLQWTDNASDESGFVIERATGVGSTAFVVIKSLGANVTEWTDESPQANTTYTYQVRAERFSEPRSAPSNSFMITTTSRPSDALDGTDLGAVGVPGSFSNSGGVITIDASGTDIWDSADSGYFAYKVISGNFDIRARVASLGNTHPWAKAGVMARERLDDWSQNAFTLVTADNVAGLQSRWEWHGSTTFTGGPWVNAPYWVRLVRSGSTFTSYISPDGVTWQTIGTTSITLPPTMYVGVAATSHNNSVTTRATFTDLQITP
jgi:regulation of enolase protein 1 (concanavalin A-like superfamily)